MKKRIMSAVIGILAAAVVMTLNITRFPFLLNIVLAVIACMALYEVLAATKFISNKGIVVTSFAATALILFIPAFPREWWTRLFAACGAAYFIALFAVLLASNDKSNVERIGLASMVTEIIALPFYSLLYMYWQSPYDTDKFRYVGQALVIYVLAVSWLADTGALFAGMLFGKHKLAPKISPKKTVEGMIGGFVFSMGMVSLIAYLLTGPLHLTPLKVHWANLLIITAISCIVSVIGDLSFSIIKRCFDVKDYGNIMPGHGGVLDRFDSVIFVSPVVCILNMYMPIIIR